MFVKSDIIETYKNPLLNKHKDIFYLLLDKILIIITFFSLCLETTNAQLRINEVMQGNMNVLYDSNKRNPESWIEVYNPTDKVVFSNDYRLGKSSKYEESFKFQHIYGVLPGCYMIVTCDEDRGNVEMTLDTDGGMLYLFDDQGNIIDSLSYPKMSKPDVAWGYENDGDRCGMMLRPTPGAPNTGIGDVLSKKVNFSVQGGVWEHFDPFYVELTAKDVPDYYSEQQDVDTSVCIRYTLDGSEPTDSSKIYTEPIYVSTSTVIRAKVFDVTKPLIASNAVSYIYHGRPVDKNVVSIITDSLYYYGEEEGIMGNRTFAALDYRRPMNFEYFPLEENDDTKQLNLLCKGRAGGNTSRLYDAYVNLVLYAKKRYGEKHFKNVFWPHLKPKVKENKSVYLRCGSKKSGCVRDVLSLNMASFLDVDYQANDALSVYLNGKYYGLLYMYERSNDDYVWANYDKLDNIDLISIEYTPKVKSGTIDEFEKFMAFWQKSPHTLEEWKKWMDVDSFIDYMALEMFGENRDFWQNNVRMYKSREDSSAVWRFIATDFDQTFTNFHDEDYFEWGKDSTSHKTDYTSGLWRGLLNSEEFQSLFLDRIIAYHGDFLNNKIYKACVDSLYNLLDQDIIKTRELYYDGDDGLAYRKQLWKYLQKRSEKFHMDLQSSFSLGKSVNVIVNSLNDEVADIYYNDVKLKTNSFDGWDFVGRTISLRAQGDKNIAGWIVEKYNDNTIEIERYPNHTELTYEILSNVDKIVFTPIDSYYNPIGKDCDKINALTDVELFNLGCPIIIYDMTGRQLYNSDFDSKIVISRKSPRIISVDGCVKKTFF